MNSIRSLLNFDSGNLNTVTKNENNMNASKNIYVNTAVNLTLCCFNRKEAVNCYKAISARLPPELSYYNFNENWRIFTLIIQSNRLLRVKQTVIIPLVQFYAFNHLILVLCCTMKFYRIRTASVD